MRRILLAVIVVLAPLAAAAAPAAGAPPRASPSPCLRELARCGMAHAGAARGARVRARWCRVHGAGARVELRTLWPSGRWSRWARAVAGEPVWSGRAVAVQMRGARPARGLRVRAVAVGPAGGGERRSGRGCTQRRGRAADRPAQRVGSARPLSPARGGALRARRLRGRPPHRVAVRLLARAVGRDRARHLPLPPRREPLERHRLRPARRSPRRSTCRRGSACRRAPRTLLA